MWSTDGEYLFTLSDEDYEILVEGDLVVVHEGEGESAEMRLVQATKVDPDAGNEYES